MYDSDFPSHTSIRIGGGECDFKNTQRGPVRAQVALFWEVCDPGATRSEAWTSPRFGFLKPVALVISTRMVIFVAILEIP